MFFKKKKKNLLKCKALVCCADFNNCEKIQEQLYSADTNGFELFFYRVDTTRFALEAKKMLRKSTYDFLVIDAYMENIPMIQIVANAKKENPQLKVLVLTPVLSEDIKKWKEVGSIDGFQLIPYQLIPFLKNVVTIVKGEDKKETLKIELPKEEKVVENNKENEKTSLVITKENDKEESDTSNIDDEDDLNILL